MVSMERVVHVGDVKHRIVYHVSAVWSALEMVHVRDFMGKMVDVVIP